MNTSFHSNLNNSDLVLVIPTYRPKQIASSVKRYADNLRIFQHSLPIAVFDDNDSGGTKKLIEQLETIDNSGGIYYIGAHEKAASLRSLQRKTKIDGSLLEHIFKPSYGGNRNFTLLYTQGLRMISVDDDMYPVGLFERKVSDLAEGEVCKGRYVPKDLGIYIEQDQDIYNAFDGTVGKKVREVDALRGEGIIDSATDLLKNTTLGNLGKSTLNLIPGNPNEDAIIKVAQTYRTGSSDVDAKDYADAFMRCPDLIMRNDLGKVFILSGIRSCTTKTNWRGDCGVSAYDNRTGLPPFIPTRLRFEDYCFRMWFEQNPQVASAHVNAVQTHRRSPYNRSTIPEDFHNEELSNHMKGELKRCLVGGDDHSLHFEGEVSFTMHDARKIMDRTLRIYKRSLRLAEKQPENAGLLLQFANSCYNTCSQFNLRELFEDDGKRVQNEYQLLQKTMEVWPRILEESRKINLPVKKIK